MAIASKEVKRVQVTKYEDVEFVVLQLTKDEAQVVSDVLARVGGSPSKSRRGLCDDVANALTEAGVIYNDNAEDISKTFNQVRFEDTE